jgi:hypothetical protein
MRPPLLIEWEGDSLGKLDPSFQQNQTGIDRIPLGLGLAYANGLELHFQQRHTVCSWMYPP